MPIISKPCHWAPPGHVLPVQVTPLSLPTGSSFHSLLATSYLPIHFFWRSTPSSSVSTPLPVGPCSLLSVINKPPPNLPDTFTKGHALAVLTIFPSVSNTPLPLRPLPWLACVLVNVHSPPIIAIRHSHPVVMPLLFSHALPNWAISLFSAHATSLQPSMASPIQYQES